MFKELIDAAVASLLEPYAEEIRFLKNVNDGLYRRVQEIEDRLGDRLVDAESNHETLLRRVTALEGRPDPFDQRSYIEERLAELDAKRDPPTAEAVAEALSARRLKQIGADLEEKLPDAIAEWASAEDWTQEIKQALKDGAISDEDMRVIIQDYLRQRLKGETVTIVL
jgi:hypothetical protein